MCIIYFKTKTVGPIQDQTACMQCGPWAHFTNDFSITIQSPLNYNKFTTGLNNVTEAQKLSSQVVQIYDWQTVVSHYDIHRRCLSGRVLNFWDRTRVWRICFEAVLII